MHLPDTLLAISRCATSIIRCYHAARLCEPRFCLFQFKIGSTGTMHKSHHMHYPTFACNTQCDGTHKENFEYGGNSLETLSWHPPGIPLTTFVLITKLVCSPSPTQHSDSHLNEWYDCEQRDGWQSLSRIGRMVRLVPSLCAPVFESNQIV